MPQSDVRTGNGTEFWIFDGAEMSELGEIIDVPEFPGGDRDLIETTHMKTGAYKAYMPSPRKDGREVEIVMNLIPNSLSEQLCELVVNAGDDRAYWIIYTTPAGVRRRKAGTCIARQYRASNPMADRRTAGLTVKWTNDAVDELAPAL